MRSADSLMIVAMSGDVVIDTSLQGFAELPGQWQQLLDEADASSQREAETIVTIDGQPFQLIALPLYLPRQVAWIIGGFAQGRAVASRSCLVCKGHARRMTLLAPRRSWATMAACVHCNALNVIRL